MSWVAHYIGIPYADKCSAFNGCDCWGLVRLVYRHQHSVELKSYADSYATCEDPDSGNALIRAGVLEGWQKVSEPQPFDLLVFRVGGSPWHCGLVSEDVDTMLHAPCFDRRGRPVMSRCELWDTPMHRLDGMYRHAHLAR